MAFLSVWWLVGLVPWAALAIWLFRGRRPRVRVPFLSLWRGPIPLEIPKSGWEAPPIWVMATLIAILAAILAAARPLIRLTTARHQPITIVVDRGITMSARREGMTQFSRAAQKLNDALRSRLATSASVDLLTVPGEWKRTSIGQWAGVVAGESPTALDTRDSLRRAIRDRLGNDEGPVIVLSDLPVGIDDPRVVQIAHDGQRQNVAIVHVAARVAPTPQVMVQLKNDSTSGTATIRVSSGIQQIDQRVVLPGHKGRQNYFFDLPSLDSEIEVDLMEADDQPADDRAWLVREGANPKIEARSPLSPELQRMIEVYSRHRPSSAESKTVLVLNSNAQLSRDNPGAIVLPATEPLQLGTPAIAAHPVTEHVSWDAMPADVRIARNAPADWKPLVTIGGKTLVAVRSDPVRQIWVGFESQAWARTTDFVVFWANVFNWLGEGQEHYGAHGLDEYQPGWKLVTGPNISPRPADGQWPGIYQMPDGQRIALNTPQVDSRAGSHDDWKSRLAEALSSPALGIEAAPYLLLISIGLIILAVLSWKRPNLTPFPARRTF